MAVAPNQHIDVSGTPESAADAFERFVYLTMPHRADQVLRLHHAVVAEVVHALTGAEVLEQESETQA